MGPIVRIGKLGRYCCNYSLFNYIGRVGFFFGVLLVLLYRDCLLFDLFGCVCPLCGCICSCKIYIVLNEPVRLRHFWRRSVED